MRIVALALSALLLLNCASAPPQYPRLSDVPEDFRLLVRVENQVFNRVAVFMMNSGAHDRIVTCDPITICPFALSKAQTQRALRDGWITLGWRWSGGYMGAVHGELTTEVWTDVTVTLNLTETGVWIFPMLQIPRT